MVLVCVQALMGVELHADEQRLGLAAVRANFQNSIGQR